MNSFLNRSKGRVAITEIIGPYDSKVTGMEASKLINDYFCKIGANLARVISPGSQKFTVNGVKCKFKWNFPISEKEVQEEVDKLNETKSSGVSCINTKILKVCLSHCIPEFTRLLNNCYERGMFPTSWKEATVVPIPKGNKVKSLNNIRPISLLPIPGKIFEHILHKRIYMYLQEFQLLSDKQAGFRKNYGIHDPTIDLLDFIHRSFNNRKQVLCIFIDMAKAFNSLSIPILLCKLKKLGFDGNMYNLLKSYSEERRQVTNFNGSISSSELVDFGVAQGSVLGPLLFSVYMNNLPLIFSKLNIRMYADDTVLFCEIDIKSNYKQVAQQINEELSSFEQWCRANLLTVNTDKSKCMLFRTSYYKGTDMESKIPPLLLNGERLGFVNHY